MTHKLIEIIQENKHKFCDHKSNLLKQKRYEREIADLFDGTFVNNSFFDILVPYKDREIKIELKKGCSFWLNEIKFAQMKLDKNVDVVLIFFHLGTKGGTKFLKTIFILESPKKLFKMMSLSTAHCTYIVNRKEQLKTNLCYQRSLTGTNLRQIADHVIDMTE